MNILSKVMIYWLGGLERCLMRNMWKRKRLNLRRKKLPKWEVLN